MFFNAKPFAFVSLVFLIQIAFSFFYFQSLPKIFVSLLNLLQVGYSAVLLLLSEMSCYITLNKPAVGADPGFFLGVGAPLRNGIKDNWLVTGRKQIFIANTKKKAGHLTGGGGGGRGAHPMYPPTRSARSSLGRTFKSCFTFKLYWNRKYWRWQMSLKKI